MPSMGYASGADFRETSLSEEIVTMYELLEALEETIKSAEPSKRKARADTFDAYSKDCPDDFFLGNQRSIPNAVEAFDDNY